MPELLVEQAPSHEYTFSFRAKVLSRSRGVKPT